MTKIRWHFIEHSPFVEQWEDTYPWLSTVLVMCERKSRCPNSCWSAKKYRTKITIETLYTHKHSGVRNFSDAIQNYNKLDREDPEVQLRNTCPVQNRSKGMQIKNTRHQKWSTVAEKKTTTLPGVTFPSLCVDDVNCGIQGTSPDLILSNCQQATL